MSGGSGPSDGVQERQALIDQINANSDFTPEQRAALVGKAKSIITNNIADLGGGLKHSVTLDAVNAVTQEFQTAASSRAKQLLENRATLSAQLAALSGAPGSKQTTNLTALTAPVEPKLV